MLRFSPLPFGYMPSEGTAPLSWRCFWRFPWALPLRAGRSAWRTGSRSGDTHALRPCCTLPLLYSSLRARVFLDPVALEQAQRQELQRKLGGQACPAVARHLSRDEVRTSGLLGCLRRGKLVYSVPYVLTSANLSSIHCALTYSRAPTINRDCGLETSGNSIQHSFLRKLSFLNLCNAPRS